MISFPWHRVPTRFADFVHESAWFLPAVAASIGVAAGVATTSADYEPVLGTVRVTVDRERDTLVAALALLFTGLSIVLSVGLSSIQNVANRFSLRLMSVILRGLETRLVVSVFVVALAFVVTAQVRLRSADSDAPASPLTLLVGFVVVVLSGVAIIGYVGRISQWMRADRTLARVQRTIRRASARGERARAHGRSIAAGDLEAPAGSTPVTVTTSGYLAAIDLTALRRHVRTRGSVLGIDAGIGDYVVPGDVVGWVEPAPSPQELARIENAGQILAHRPPTNDPTYGLRIITDMALSALSPAVNDPYTAVQAIETLTAVLTDLARRPTGPYAITDATGNGRVLVSSPGMADYVHLSTDEILVYGVHDPTVMRALDRCAREVQRCALTDDDRDVATDLRVRIAASQADPTTA
jgi:uncharacterized membrane protein